MLDNSAGSTKRLAIVKSNARSVIIVSVASFVTVFCLMASKSVISQNQYLGRVIKAKATANKQLTDNVTAANQLIQSYQSFVAMPVNVIGGSSSGTGSNDGDNAKIVLDALPSQYDFPALTSSIEKTFDSLNIKGNISGTDDQINQQSNNASASPQPVPVPFNITAQNISYSSVQQLVSKLQSSIRPMQIDSLDLTGATTSMTLTLAAHTYYQPGKTLTLTTEVVK